MLLFIVIVDHSDNEYSGSPGLPPPILNSSDEDDVLPKQPIDLTVSIDPNDEDFMKKVEEHIFSPEATKTHQNVELGGRNIVITSTVITDLDNVKQEDEKVVDDLEVTPTHSANSHNKLTEQDTSALSVPASQNAEFSPIDVGSELYNLDKTLEEDCEGEESEEDEYDDEDGSSKNDGSGEDDGGSSRTDDSNLEWIKCIGVFEYRVSREIATSRGNGQVVASDEDGYELMDYGLLINELEVLLLYSNLLFCQYLPIYMYMYLHVHIEAFI